jgi:hypothetical protein
LTSSLTAVNTVSRCVVVCNNIPTECDELSLCAGAVTLAGISVAVDYTDAHCSPLSLLEQ